MTRAERPRRRVAIAGGLVALALTTTLTACESSRADDAAPGPSSASPSRSSAPSTTPPTAYVALGDSYAAAPFVPTTDVAGGCFRSSGSYPHLVSAALRPSAFVDVSCSGAASSDVVGRQRVAGGDATVPPQLRAVRKDADLVTIGIGGNDGNLFTRLVCSFTRDRLPQCQRFEGTDDVEQTLATTRADVTRTLRKVARRASPDALVLLVGYPRLVDPSRSCASLPLDSDQQRRFHDVERQLRAVQRQAAAAAGVEFLDLWPASRGHEICSADPWVNGKDTDRDRALAYHPFASEQQAVADLVAQRWSDAAATR